MSSPKKFRARLNKNGTIDTQKIGVKSFSISELYHWLITISWMKFYTVLTITYAGITLFFTIAYLVLDPQNVKGINSVNLVESSWRLFFFSAETLSMVGGVGLVPEGLVNHFILTTESMAALSLLTLITGLLFARFSKQRAVLRYSNKAVVAPHKNGKAFMVRVANACKRQSALVDMKAEVVFIWYESDESNKRNLHPMKLEMKKVSFIPVSWTIVHPIDDKSPFTKFDLNQIDFEILVRISATDSITGQVIYCGHAYSKNEIEWDARFKPCYEVTEHGITLVHLDQVGALESVAV